MSHSDLEVGHPGFVQNAHQTRTERKKEKVCKQHDGKQRMTEKRGDCCRLHCGKQHEVMFPGEHTGSNRVPRNPSEESVNLQPSVQSNFVFIWNEEFSGKQCIVFKLCFYMLRSVPKH